MKSSAILITLLLSACATSEPRPTAATLRFAVNGIAIGSPESAVLRTFGQPITTESGFDEEFGQGEWRDMTFHGLEVGVNRPTEYVKHPPREAYVYRLVLHDSRWAFSNGVGIGSSRADVLSILGEPERAEHDGHREYLFYSLADFDCTIRITIVSGKVEEASISESWS